MKFTIDRFEEDYAIVELEDGQMEEIPRGLLPQDAKEGDIISLVKEEDEGEERKKRIENKFNNLFCKE